MRHRLQICGISLLLAPIAIGTPRGADPDSGTTFYVGGGGGSYVDVARGCEGQVLSRDERSMHEFAAAVEHKFSKPVRIGLRAGRIHDDVYSDGVNQYWNPHAALDTRYISIGAGYMSAQENFVILERDHSMTAHLRVGKRTGPYASIGFFDAVPIYTNGYATAGLGGRLHPRIDVWVGASFWGPHDATGALISIGYRPSRRLGLHLDARLGAVEGSSESGVAFGVSTAFGR